MPSVSLAQAEICLEGYDRNNRAEVIQEGLKIKNNLFRIAEIGETAATNVLSLTQARAFEYELRAVVSEIDLIGQTNHPELTSRTNSFLNGVINSDYLGLSSVTVLGNTSEEIRDNARNLLNTVKNSMNKANLCLFGSWQRHLLNGIENDGTCGGGYDRTDLFATKRAHIQALALLNEMSLLARQAATQLLTETQRNIANFDLQFLKEELDRLGEAEPFDISLRTVSNKTKHFVETVIDPTYLGIKTIALDGSTVTEQRHNAIRVYFSLNKAKAVLRNCMINNLN